MTRDNYLSKSNLDVDRAMEAINRELGVDVKDKSKDRYTADTRKMFCVFLYNNTRMTLQNIASVVGKSVGNVHYYVTTHAKQIEENVAYADRYELLQVIMREESVKLN